MNTHPTQSKTIRAQLLSAIKEGEFSECNRLPRESVLAEKMGISRTQLRDILASLEREGFITRRHGVGTIINRHVLSAQSRMDIEVEFLNMIQQSGYTPAVKFVEVREDVADERISAHLQIPVGTPVLRVSRLCTADGKPAIYCEDVFEKALVRSSYTKKDLKYPIFHFLQENCGIIPYMDLTDIRPIVANDELAAIFDIPMGAPLLNMDEVDYDIDGTPVFCSNEYFADGIFRHTVLRKKL